MKTLLIFTDTTSSQVNGVTRSIENLKKHLIGKIDFHIVSTDDFFSIPFPGYKEIQLSLSFPRSIYKKIKEIEPDFIHIETEWPIGFTAAMICKKHKIPYTTSFHTKFPEYLNMRSSLIKKEYVHSYLRYIHGKSDKIFISNSGLIPYLERHKYDRYAIVPLGIDHSLFYIDKNFHKKPTEKITLLFVGRIAIEKNIEDFLKISDKYHKVVVGDWPEKENLQEKYPNVEFLGVKKWQELANIYRQADIFIFPSKTDTLGLVNLEAMACGKPVIAYDIENMQGIIFPNKNGILINENTSLETGISDALKLQPEICAESVKHFCWKNYSQIFLQEQSQIPKILWK